jgi:hypothetical protein
MTTPRCAVAGVLAANVLALTSCTSTSSDSADAAPATDAQAVAPTTSYESERHAYRLELPPEWEITEYDGAWTRLGQFNPPGEVPGEDVASGPLGSGWLVANSMALAQGMSPADWLTRLDRRVRSGLPPGCRLTSGSDVLDGEPVVVGRNRCDGMTIVGRSLAHAGRGYYFTIGFRTGDSTSGDTLDGIVASIRFVDQ